jgi:glutamine synthetase
MKIKAQEKRLKELCGLVDAFVESIDELEAEFEHAESHDGTPDKHAKTYRDKVVPAMGKLRTLADQLETMVDDSEWPLPKYREILFLQ